MAVNTQMLVNDDLKHIWHPCTQMKDHETLPLIPMQRGEGVYLIDFNNNRYIAIAIVLHTLGNIPAALYQRDVCPRLGSELFSIAYSIVVCIFAYNVYKSLPKKKTVSKEKDFDIAGKKLG